MEYVNVLGYFKEIKQEGDKSKDELFYFVAYENDLNYTQSDIQEGKPWVEGYNVIDGHFQLQDREYLTSCQSITKDEYLSATKGFHTPAIYV